MASVTMNTGTENDK